MKAIHTDGFEGTRRRRLQTETFLLLLVVYCFLSNQTILILFLPIFLSYSHTSLKPNTSQLPPTSFSINFSSQPNNIKQLYFLTFSRTKQDRRKEKHKHINKYTKNIGKQVKFHGFEKKHNILLSETIYIRATCSLYYSLKLPLYISCLL